ncbi:MAG: phosphoenolpyruvate protein kinase, partial [Candidatus Methanofastidiosa archaeon]|nr:phosphoenolpyruvate protein kinase [Candidatus Methanofastidiosa archaeon]
MIKECISLSSLPKEDIAKVGGKAANLCRLIEGGFPVPEGFVVTADAYMDFFKANRLDIGVDECLQSADHDDESSLKECSDRIKGIILDKSIDEGLLLGIREHMEAYVESLWAVRSSAVAEDLPEASFAGQQDTFLNLMPSEVAEAIKRCWASYWNERALAYRQNANIPHLGGVAVIVQRMVDANVSGVMFTHDPVDLKSDNIIIESSWGLGESIVSGMVSPDRFIYDPVKREIIERRTSSKRRGIFLSSEKSNAVDIEDCLQNILSLTDEQIKELVVLGKRVEDYMESPQDIEWSIEGERIFLLQARPITTLQREEEILWTRAYGDEYWADVTSPLFFSVLGHYLTNYVNHEGSKVMGYKELTGLKLLKLHKGHIYFNSKVLEEVFTFNPRFSRTKELLNYFPVKDQERIANAKTKTLRRLWAEARIMLKDPDGSIFRTDKAYRKWAVRYLSAMVSYDNLDLKTLTDDELEEQYRYMENAFLKHFQLIRYGMVTHSIGTNLMIKRWLVDWLDDRTGELYSKLISGLPDNKTIRTNIAIARLANTIRANPDLRKVLLEEGNSKFLYTIGYHPEYDEYQGFISEYGHRSHTRELLYPRWEEDQGLVVDILRSLVSSSPMDFDDIERKKIEERKEAERDILGRIAELPNGRVRSNLFKLVMGYAQTYLIFRENQRFYLDHILYRIRRLFLEYGRRFAEREWVDAADNIFFLTKEEIFSIANKGDKAPLRQVASRKREFEAYKNILPPKFLRGRIEFDDT